MLCRTIKYTRKRVLYSTARWAPQHRCLKCPPKSQSHPIPGKRSSGKLLLRLRVFGVSWITLGTLLARLMLSSSLGQAWRRAIWGIFKTVRESNFLWREEADLHILL